MVDKQLGKDGGWGWMVLTGAWLIQFVFGIAGRSSGIFYVVFLQRFGETATFTAWATAIPMLLWGILGPAASGLINKYSCRVVTLLGGLFYTAGLLSAAFSPNLLTLSLTFSILTGIGMAFTYTSTFIIPTDYFIKKRALAMGMMSTGSAAGAMVGPVLVIALFEHYGFQGMMLISCAIYLHIFVGGCLFRPFDQTVRLLKFEKQDMEQSLGDLQTDKDFCNLRASSGFATPSSGPGEYENLMTKNEANLLVNDKKHSDQQTQLQEKQICAIEKSANDKDVNAEKRKKLFNWSLFKDQSFVLLMVLTFFAMTCFGINITFLTALATDNGVPLFEATLLLSLVGLSDGLFRIPFGIFLDRPKIRQYLVTICICMLLFSGVLISSLPLTNNIYVLGVMCLARGICTGAFLSQRTTILCDIIGEERVASAFGIQLLVTGVAALIGRTAGGVIKDAYGAYDLAFYVSGSLLAIGCGIFLLYWKLWRKPTHHKSLIITVPTQ